ncbi:MAG: CRISPR-associated endoribonuclease Cas6 [Bacteroidales bacterium]|nr:CRISPR-associated endoribonuclease Cas6 [Bacteroidales bacterium]
MRLYLKLTPNKSPVPFNYQEKLTGALHKWLGTNSLHDTMSLYSFSWLHGGHKTGSFLTFPNGAEWFISAWSNETIKDMIKGIQSDNEIAHGIFVREIMIRENPDFTAMEHFKLASPVFIKRSVGKSNKYYTYNDQEAGELLTETLKNKMNIAGISGSDFEICFDKEYCNPKTKVITYKGIKNKANICPIRIKGNAETKAFAWCVGVGSSTGIGFGALV